MIIADRLQSVEEYYFSKKLREVRELVAQGKPVINMGIGSPDLAPSDTVLHALKNSVTDIGAHQYPRYQGLPEFSQGISDFYSSTFGVGLVTAREILPLMGSKA